MRKSLLCAAALIMTVSLALLTGCEGVFTGEPTQNLPPEIWLSSGPVEGDTTGYQIRFYWSGWDPDGEIAFFEFCVVAGDPIGFSYADTTGLDKWMRTQAHDSLFRVSADENPRPWKPDGSYTLYDKTHTFFIRAVDLQGMRSEPAYRSFTAWTLAPIVRIDRPPTRSPHSYTYSSVITFAWTGIDPIDSPSNVQDPVAIKYLNVRVQQIIDDNPNEPVPFNVVKHMNEKTEYYEQFWTPWIPYRAQGDSGRVATIEVETLGQHVFALQALDDAGAVTATFDRNRNVRIYNASQATGPQLTVTEPLLGSYRFVGPMGNYVLKDLPPGVALNFRWKATADHYGGEIRSYRYGWDIQQLDDPSGWDVIASPFITSASPKTYYSGVHRLLVEVVDNGRRITYGKFEVNIVPFSMERNLLWVDDYPLGAPSPSMMIPSEAMHDSFWINICRRAVDFRSERDVFDVAANNAVIPDIRLIGQYSNIIWTYSPADQRGWRKVIEFTPESQAGGQTVTLNYLSLFLARGGRLLTAGQADRRAGLADAFNYSARLPAAFRLDMAGYNTADTSGVNSMPYRDYCVSVVDKIEGQFHISPEYPTGVLGRDRRRDAMRWLYKEDTDATPGAIERYPTFPDRLELSPLVTCTTCWYRDYQAAGNPFTLLEVYDPQYWMDFKFLSSRRCYHPMYRMRTRNTGSPLDHQTVALIVTRYRERFENEIEQGVPLDFTPANSFHFGFPLWYFNHEDVHTIMEAIFSEWGILKD